MPFVQRVVEPKFPSRTSLWDADGKPRVFDNELEAVTNNTLSNALRQLASLVLAANNIFEDLNLELRKISERSESLKAKIGNVEDKVALYDPKKVAVLKYRLQWVVLYHVHLQRRDRGYVNARRPHLADHDEYADTILMRIACKRLRRLK